MIAVAYPKEERTERTEKTEVYTTKIPKLACLKRAFAREIIEMDFGEEFETQEYNPEKEVGRRKRNVCYYKGSFVFSPDVKVSIYEAKNFARIYLDYDSCNEDQVEDVRQRLVQEGLVRRIIGIKRSNF